MQVLDDEGQPIDEGRFGNNRSSSDAGDTLPIDHPRALSQAVLEEYAQRTAVEMAEENGVSLVNVFNDLDLETCLQEQFDEHEGRLDGPAP